MLFQTLTDKQQQIVVSYWELLRELNREPTTYEVADAAYATCDQSYVWTVKNKRCPEVFETEPEEVQVMLHEEVEPPETLNPQTVFVTNAEPEHQPVADGGSEWLFKALRELPESLAREVFEEYF